MDKERTQETAGQEKAKAGGEGTSPTECCTSCCDGKASGQDFTWKGFCKDVKGNESMKQMMKKCFSDDETKK
jgi:hypothetical protein